MSVQYKIISKFYDLLDVIYFRKEKTSPRQALLKMIPQDQALSVLELCSGTGTNSLLIAKNRPQAMVYGIDRSNEMLEIALNKSTQDQLSNIELRRRDATNTGLKAGQFDYIILSLVLHESSPELATSLLHEAKRLLKKNGRLLVLEWEEPRSILQKVMFCPIFFLEPGDFKSFVRADFNRYFRNHGLQLMRTVHCDYSRVFEVAPILENKA